MRIKSVPEDFVVEEIARHEPLAQGPYLLARLRKRGIGMEEATDAIAHALGLSRRDVGYAGAKDAHAVTVQHVTLKARPGVAQRMAQLSRPDIALEPLGFLREPLGLGMLEGNRFTITCRRLREERLEPRERVPNYFDEQRFSVANAAIGRLIIQGKFEDAALLVARTDRRFGPKLAEHLASRLHDGVGALRILSERTLLMYVHAYQSLLFNEALSGYLRMQDPHARTLEGPVPLVLPSRDVEDIAVPIVGFATRLEGELRAPYEELLAREGITGRDFVVRAIPALTLEGSQREAFRRVRDFSASEREPDDLHPGYEKQVLSFALPKGSYATIVVKCCYGTGVLETREAGDE